MKSKLQWQTERFEELLEAISEKYNAQKPIPLEWIEEYNELTKIVNNA